MCLLLWCGSYYHIGISYANLGNHLLAISAFTQALASPSIPSRAVEVKYIHERAKSLQMAGTFDEVSGCVYVCVSPGLAVV